ncbi:MAG: HAD family phosphatase [Clostridia bacterium]|nr:HAD family phosphatase [Clostridia bacterium]
MKAFIFDMDGVLVDSQPYHFKADIDTMAEYGIIRDEKFYEAFAGTVTRDRMTTLKKMFSLDASVEEMTKRREQMILDVIADENIEPVSGIPQLLSHIKEKGLKTAVASSSSYELINMVLEKLDIAKYFDSLTSGSDVKRGKPAPDVFLLAAERLGVSPDECIVVEDSENGVKAAKAARMKALGYINPTSGKQCLDEADIVTDDFNGVNIEDLMCLG